jgi:hypothetical protein
MLIACCAPMPSRADGMPKAEMLVKEKVKVVKTVRRVRHRVLRRAAPAIVGLPGPYDLRADPPPPLDSAYQPAMLSYFHDVSITGYRPGSTAAYVLHEGDEHLGRVYYHRTGWAGAQGPKLPSPGVDNFPFRKYTDRGVLQYDGLLGEYVPLSARDSALAMQVSHDKPVPLWPAPAR